MIDSQNYVAIFGFSKIAKKYLVIGLNSILVRKNTQIKIMEFEQLKYI